MTDLQLRMAGTVEPAIHVIPGTTGLTSMPRSWPSAVTLPAGKSIFDLYGLAESSPT
ncbi:hypothetical protein [Kitasatospora griseola]|uniref:hypothetical protein n=1 Tax=Kitasatospora griseola TaxID=2064 RepID=UPI00342B7896